MWPTPDAQNHRDGTVERDHDRQGRRDNRHGKSLHHAINRPDLYPTTSETSPDGSPPPQTQLTLFAVDSPVSPSRWPASVVPKRTNGGSGPSSPVFLASFDPDTWLLKTSQACALEGWTTFSGTLPRSGMMRNGRVYERPMSAPHIDENGSGLWPTPRAEERQQHNSSDKYVALSKAVRTWPTPRVTTGGMIASKKQVRAVLEGRINERGAGACKLELSVEVAEARKDWATPTAHPRTHTPRQVDHGEQLANQVRGQLNPTWVEWLMGFPLGWTDLDVSEMQLCLR